MTRVGRRRTLWLAPCAAVGALLICLPAGAADDPRQWLEKMNQALASRNYDGTFVHLSGGRVETMRIVHRVIAGRIKERLASLDGSGREFIHEDEELTCYLPDQHLVLVEPRQDHGPFLGSLPQFGADMTESYRIESMAGARVLGRHDAGDRRDSEGPVSLRLPLVARRQYGHAARRPSSTTRAVR